MATATIPPEVSVLLKANVRLKFAVRRGDSAAATAALASLDRFAYVAEAGCSRLALCLGLVFLWLASLPPLCCPPWLACCSPRSLCWAMPLVMVARQAQPKAER